MKRKLVILTMLCLTSCGSSITDISILNNIQEGTAWCDVEYLRCEANSGFWNKCEKQWGKCVND